MSLIVLLILAAISLSSIFGEKGIFKRAEITSNKYNEAKARETLETVLLADGQYEKQTNPTYNQDDFIDDLIKNEIEGADVKGDVAIVGDYAYELDRSVPKIGRYLGLAKDLVFPTVDATVKLADDKKTATITINASEEKNGINKREIWLLGEKIDEFPYDNESTVTKEYPATQNGKYTIKAYGNLMASKTIEVEGILASVKFEPNGSTGWKKEHSTIVTIEGTSDKVVNAKYCWINSVAEPTDDKFTKEFKSGDTITKDEITGTYYLWTMLETQSGEKVKWRSEGFNFDNEGPTVTLISIPVSDSSFTLTATASDKYSKLTECKFYINGELKETKDISSGTSSYTATGVQTGNTSCYVIVTDSLGNETKKTVTGITKKFVWTRWNVIETYTWALEKSGSTYVCGNYCYYTAYSFYKNVKINCTTGCITGTDLSESKYWPSGYKEIKGNTVVYGSVFNWTTCCNKYHTGQYKFQRYVSVKTNTTRKKGTTQYSNVTSTSATAYPKNGYQDGYWYVYAGVQ